MGFVAPGGRKSMSQTTSSQVSQSETDTDPDGSHGSPTEGGQESTSPGDSDSSESKAQGAAVEDTGVLGQNQAETTAPPPSKAEETLADRLARRQAQVESDLRNRESQILGYVRHRWHIEYYGRWKTEANEFFNQAVIYRLRSHRHGKTPPKR